MALDSNTFNAIFILTLFNDDELRYLTSELLKPNSYKLVNTAEFSRRNRFVKVFKLSANFPKIL